jgi:polyphosphate kinase 2 (PPK2 family)
MIDSPYLVKPGSKLKIRNVPPMKLDRSRARKRPSRPSSKIFRLDELQELLYAESKRAILIVFQAMDCGGKDGAIEHVFSGVNPQGCSVTSFKQPTSQELA